MFNLDEMPEEGENSYPFPVRPYPRLLPFTDDDLVMTFKRMEEGPGIHYGSLMLDPYGETHEYNWDYRSQWRSDYGF